MNIGHNYSQLEFLVLFILFKRTSTQKVVKVMFKNVMSISLPKAHSPGPALTSLPSMREYSLVLIAQQLFTGKHEIRPCSG